MLLPSAADQLTKPPTAHRTLSPAGVDPQVSLFQRLPEPSEGSMSSKQLPWAHLSSQRPHSHDVRAMCLAAGQPGDEGAWLFTCGHDTHTVLPSGDTV